MKLNILLLACLLTLSSMAAMADPAREQVEVTFDRNKGKLYAEYGRALKENPRLAGKIVFDIDIATGGNVTDCRVVTSQFPRDFDEKLCARIRQFQFGPRNSPSTVRKPVDFFPAG